MAILHLISVPKCKVIDEKVLTLSSICSIRDSTSSRKTTISFLSLPISTFSTRFWTTFRFVSNISRRSFSFWGAAFSFSSPIQMSLRYYWATSSQSSSADRCTIHTSLSHSGTTGSSDRMRLSKPTLFRSFGNGCAWQPNVHSLQRLVQGGNLGI